MQHNRDKKLSPEASPQSTLFIPVIASDSLKVFGICRKSQQKKETYSSSSVKIDSSQTNKTGEKYVSREL